MIKFKADIYLLQTVVIDKENPAITYVKTIVSFPRPHDTLATVKEDTITSLEQDGFYKAKIVTARHIKAYPVTTYDVNLTVVDAVVAQLEKEGYQISETYVDDIQREDD